MSLSTQPRILGDNARVFTPEVVSEVDEFLGKWLGLSHPSVGSSITTLEREGFVSACCHRCGQGVGRGELTLSGCGSCRESAAILDGVVRVGAYTGQLAQLIRSLKYGGRWELAKPLGHLLADELRGGVCSRRSEVIWVVIPMPMPRWRHWYRGVDHAGLIAGAVARQLGLELLRPIRKVGGEPQAGLPRSRRRKSPVKDYRLKRQGIRGFGGVLPNLQGRSVILVDDVLTTGRSMCAAGSLLRRLGPDRIVAGALAVTEDNRSPKSPLSALGN